MFRPRRRPDVIEQAVDGELVVYALDTDEVHLLNTTSAAVWRHCDGDTSIDDIAAHLGGAVDAEVVRAALFELTEAGLLAEPFPSPGRVSRRQMMKRLALAAIAVPVVTSIVAPAAAAAASACASGNLGDDCVITANCCFPYVCSPTLDICVVCVGSGQACSSAGGNPCCGGNVCPSVAGVCP